MNIPPCERACAAEERLTEHSHNAGMNEKRCPRIKAAIKKADAGMQLPEKFAVSLDKLTSVVGENELGADNQGLAGSKSELIDRWIHLGDIGVCHIAHRIELPLNLSASDLLLVQQYNAWMWGRRLEASNELNALAIGGFLKDVLDVLVDTVSGRSVPGVSAPKLAIFSGHDSTLFPILTALGAFDGEWPPYASRIHLELLRIVEKVPYVSSLVALWLPGERREAGGASTSSHLRTGRADASPSLPVKLTPDWLVSTASAGAIVPRGSAA